MHGHPTLGVKKAKPRLPHTRLSSRPGPEIGKLSEEYLKIRNEQMHTKMLSAQMNLARERGELIEKRLVEEQAAYLLVALRQRILQVPHAYARRMVGCKDAKAAKTMLHEIAISLLNDLKDLPNKVTDPNWLEELEEKEDGGK
jgi:hypothetical protein